MFSAPYDKPLLRQGDPRRLAQQGARMSGFLPVDQLGRVREVLLEGGGGARVDLAFEIGDEGKLRVSGRLDTELVFTCQRCLGPVTLPVAAEIELAMVRTEQEARQVPRALDPWLLPDDGNTDLYQMVEEELLLSLPTVAYHPHWCIDERMLSSGEPAEEPEPEENPFEVLKQLKGSPRQ